MPLYIYTHICVMIYAHIRTHTHTLTHTYIYIYIYMRACVCVCICLHACVYESRLSRSCETKNLNDADVNETHCNTLLHTAAHCNKLHHTATHGNTRQHTATHCNPLQHNDRVTHCKTMRIVTVGFNWSLLQNIVYFIGLFCKKDLQF